MTVGPVGERHDRRKAASPHAPAHPPSWSMMQSMGLVGGLMTLVRVNMAPVGDHF